MAHAHYNRKSEYLNKDKETFQEKRSADFLGAARKIGDRLHSLAVRGDDDATWLVMRLKGNDIWSVFPLGIDLYEGIPGSSLFRPPMGAITGYRAYPDI